MQIHAVIEGKTNAHDAPFFAFDGDLLTGYNIAHASVIAEAWNFVHRNLSAVADTAPSGFLHLFFGGPLLRHVVVDRRDLAFVEVCASLA